MNVGLENLVGNVGMSFTNIVLLILVVGSLIFMAMKFQIGAIMLFVTTGVAFVLFYIGGMDYVPTLIVFFVSLVMMSLSLLGHGQESGVSP